MKKTENKRKRGWDGPLKNGLLKVLLLEGGQVLRHDVPGLPQARVRDRQQQDHRQPAGRIHQDRFKIESVKVENDKYLHLSTLSIAT